MAEESKQSVPTGQNENKAKTFFIRLLSSVVLLAGTVLLVYIGELPLIIAVAAISIIGQIELYRILGFHKSILAYICYIIAAIYEALIYVSGLTMLTPLLFATMLLLIMVYVISYPKYTASEIMCALFGLIYVVFMLSFVFLTRISEQGIYTVWYIFICAWGCDTMAYVGGLLFGKHKMTPVLSPKKTIEGAVSGVIGAALIGLIYSLIFKDELSLVIDNPVIVGTILCAVCSVISMFGDLAASAIKRNYNIKDYGNLIPGHGGILDRFDSIIVIAPAVFFIMMFATILKV